MTTDILFVVVGSAWSPNQILYRRNRLALYLTSRPETAEVFWVQSGERQGGAEFPWVSSPTLRPIRAIPIAERGRAVVSYTMALQRFAHSDLLRATRLHPARHKVLVYTVPMHARLAEACEWDAIVYDCSDYWTGYRAGGFALGRVKDYLKRQSEAAVMKAANLVFASSTFLAERSSREFGRDAILIENGVDLAAFSPREVSEPIGLLHDRRPLLGFVGAMKLPKIDFSLLGALATARSGWDFLLVGPVDRDARKDLSFRRLMSLPNVTSMSQQPPSEIPSYMRRLAIGLLPYREVPYNDGVFPLKLFEYLATGLPIVGCGLPSTLGYAKPGIYAHVEATPEAFAAACDEALTWKLTPRERWVVAQGHDWRPKFDLMFDLITGRLGQSTLRQRDTGPC